MTFCLAHQNTKRSPQIARNAQLEVVSMTAGELLPITPGVGRMPIEVSSTGFAGESLYRTMRSTGITQEEKSLQEHH